MTTPATAHHSHSMPISRALAAEKGVHAQAWQRMAVKAVERLEISHAQLGLYTARHDAGTKDVMDRNRQFLDEIKP